MHDTNEPLSKTTSLSADMYVHGVCMSPIPLLVLYILVNTDSRAFVDLPSPFVKKNNYHILC
jgi:hypothetical protein